MRKDAAWGLSQMGQRVLKVIPPLTAAAQDQDGEVCVMAARALIAAGETDAAVQRLIEVVRSESKDPTGFAASQAGQILANLGPKAKKAVPALETALKRTQSGPRMSAALALAKIIPGDKRGIPILMEIARKSEDWFDDVLATLSLAMLGEDGLKALIELLKDDRVGTKVAAAKALTMTELKTNGAVDPLIETFKDKHEWVRAAAADALFGLGADTPAVIDGLRMLLKDQESEVRWAAAVALAAFRPNDKATGPIFLEKMRTNEPRDDADKKLSVLFHWRLERKLDVVLPILVAGLRDESPLVKEWAATDLGTIGPEANGACPELISSWHMIIHIMRPASHLRPGPHRLAGK